MLGVATAASAAASFADTAAFAAAFTGFGSRRGVAVAVTTATASDECTATACGDSAIAGSAAFAAAFAGGKARHGAFSVATAHIYGANAAAVTVSTATTSARIAVGVAA